MNEDLTMVLDYLIKLVDTNIELLKRKEVSATLCVLYNAHDLLDGERICPQNYIHCG